MGLATEHPAITLQSVLTAEQPADMASVLGDAAAAAIEPLIDPPPVATTASRGRRLLKNVIAGFFQRGVGVAVGLVTVPLLLHHLGAEQYGLYVTITAVVGWLQIGRLGLGNALINELVRCQASQDFGAGRRALTSLWLGSSLVLAAIGLLCVLAFPLVPWGAVFPTSSETLAGAVPHTVGLSIAFALLGMAASPLWVVYTALQEQHRATSWAVAGAVLSLSATWAAVAGGYGMAGVVVATGATMCGLWFLNGLWLFARQHPELRPRWRDRSWIAFQSMWGASAAFFVIDLATLLILQLDRFLIVQVQSGTAVTEFELAAKLYVLVSSLTSLALGPLWPAVGEAFSRNESHWVSLYLRRICLASVGIMAAALVTMAVVGQQVLSLWTQQSAVLPSRALLIILGIYFLLRVFTECHSTVLFAVGRQRTIAVCSVIHGALNLILGLSLGHRFGVVGVAAASAISYCVSSAWWVPMKAWTAINAMRPVEPVSGG